MILNGLIFELCSFECSPKTVLHLAHELAFRKVCSFNYEEDDFNVPAYQYLALIAEPNAAQTSKYISTVLPELCCSYI